MEKKKDPKTKETVIYYESLREAYIDVVIKQKETTK